MDKLKQQILEAVTEGLAGSGIRPEYITELVWQVIVKYFQNLYK